MTTKEAKTQIDKTGTVYLTLGNDTEFHFVGQVDRMRAKDGRVKLTWKLPKASHISPFDRAVISGDKNRIYTKESIQPIRLDMGVKKYEVDWDV